MSTRGTWLLPRPATNVTARPSCSATSGVIGYSLATPRIPSVPKRCRAAEGAGTLRWAVRFMGARRSRGSVTKIDELQLETKVVCAYRLNGCLQVVLVLSGHAHLALLNRRLHLELCFLEQRYDRFRLFGLDAVFDFRHDARAPFAGRFGLAHVEEPERDLALCQFLLHDRQRRRGPVLAGRVNRDRVRGLLGGRLGVFEVEALRDFLLRLVERVVDLVHLHFRDDVEARHEDRMLAKPRAGSKSDRRIHREPQEEGARLPDEQDRPGDDDKLGAPRLEATLEALGGLAFPKRGHRLRLDGRASARSRRNEDSGRGQRRELREH